MKTQQNIIVERINCTEPTILMLLMRGLGKELTRGRRVSKLREPLKGFDNEHKRMNI